MGKIVVDPCETVADALVAALGEDGAVFIAQRLGGQSVTPTSLSVAVQVVYGPNAATRLIAALPSAHETLYVPRSLDIARRGTAAEREAEIIRLARQGMPRAQIAARTGLSTRHVRRVLRAAGGHLSP